MLAGSAVAGAPYTSLAQGRGSESVLLELPSSPRGMALGGAYTAASNDAALLFTSPSRIGAEHRLTAAISGARYLLGSTLAAAAVVLPVGRGAVALGVQALDYGRVEEVLEVPGSDDGQATGESASASDAAVVLGYARGVRSVRAGVSVTALNRSLAGDGSTRVLAAAGLSAGAWRKSTVAIAVRHLGPAMRHSVSDEGAPIAMQGGVALPVLCAGSASAILFADLARVRSDRVRPAAGAEGAWAPTGGRGRVLARLGWRGGHAERGSELSGGLGVEIGAIILDYATERLEADGALIHRVGVRWRR